MQKSVVLRRMKTMANKYITAVVVCLTYYCLSKLQCLKSDEISSTSELSCHGMMSFNNVTLTAFYPNDESDEPEEYLDTRGNTFKTLQDFLDDSADYVTVSMDSDLRIPYGKIICLPQLNAHFRRRINFQVRDTASNVKGQGYRRVDICVRSEADSYDHAVNLKSTTLVM